MEEGVSIGNSLEEGKDIMLMANHGEGDFLVHTIWELFREPFREIVCEDSKMYLIESLVNESPTD